MTPSNNRSGVAPPATARQALDPRLIEPVGPVPFNRVFLTGEERSSLASVCEGGNVATDGRATRPAPSKS